MYLKLFLLFVPALVFIYVYNKLFTQNDFLNKRIIYNICGWNILHVIGFFCLCIYLQARSLRDFLFVFVMMFLWPGGEILCYWLYVKLRSSKVARSHHAHDKDKVYVNPYLPRLDDFIFNTIGVLMYYFFYLH